MFCRKLGGVIFSLLVPLGSNSSNGSAASPLRVKAAVVKQRYCAFTTDYIKLRMSTRLRIENVSEMPLMIERVILPGFYFISHSAEELGQGNYASGSVMPEHIPDVRSDAFDSEYVPEKKIVALHGHLDITVKDPWIMVSADGTGRMGGAAPGSYVLQIPILVEVSNVKGRQSQQVHVNSDPVAIQIVATPHLQGCE
jgi:hypothetical protein